MSYSAAKTSSAPSAAKTSSAPSAAAKLFCKICYDAGKKNHLSHNLRDAKGTTTCPYLLSLVCRNCKQTGHTPTWCPSLKKSQPGQAQAQQQQAQQQAQPPNERLKQQQKKTNANMFSLLSSFMEEDNPQPKPGKITTTRRPHSSSSGVKPRSPSPLSKCVTARACELVDDLAGPSAQIKTWASIVSKTPAQQPVQAPPEPVQAPPEPVQAQPVQAQPVQAQPVQAQQPTPTIYTDHPEGLDLVSPGPPPPPIWRQHGRDEKSWTESSWFDSLIEEEAENAKYN